MSAVSSSPAVSGRCEGWLQQAISERLPRAILDMPLNSSYVKEKVHVEFWGNETRFVELKWLAFIDEENEPFARINALRSAESVHGLGVATILLKSFVRAMQYTRAKGAEIALEAWTGCNSYFGHGNGAYTWSKLGFDFQSHEDLKFTVSELKHNALRVLENMGLRENLVAIERETLQKLDSANHSWEIAEICVGDVAIGKELMRTCDGARFYGHLHPNRPRSAGMIQYAKRVAQLNSIPRQTKVWVGNLDVEISQKLPQFILDMPKTFSFWKDGAHAGTWGEGARTVELKWTAFIATEGAPFARIDTLKAAKCVHGLGIATIVLQPFVQALQATQIEKAEIAVRAFTGDSSNLGKANGAYTWSKLGFDFFSEDAMASTVSELKKDIPKVLEGLGMSENLAEVVRETTNLLDSVNHSWEIAEICAGGLAIGKELMRTCENARFYGVLYPNQPESPGMIQYAKRVAQLAHVQ